VRFNRLSKRLGELGPSGAAPEKTHFTWRRS
jgi:hypothetical protein